MRTSELWLKWLWKIPRVPTFSSDWHQLTIFVCTCTACMPTANDFYLKSEDWEIAIRAMIYFGRNLYNSLVKFLLTKTFFWFFLGFVSFPWFNWMIKCFQYAFMLIISSRLFLQSLILKLLISSVTHICVPTLTKDGK